MISRFSGQYFFLSNYYPSRIVWEGITFPTVEHGFQAAKTLNGEKRIEISRIQNPARAKTAGRHLRLRDDWEDVKEQIMYELLRIKFTSDEGLRKRLADTADEVLVEGNLWHDNYWGSCSCRECRNEKHLNRLGRLLMRVRDEVKP